MVASIFASQQPAFRGGGIPLVYPEGGSPSTFTSLVGIGDSITAGSAATTAADRFLNKSAVAWSAGTPLNQGIGGTRMSNGLDKNGVPFVDNGHDRIINDAAVNAANKRDCALIAYGTNDGRYIAAPSTFNSSKYQTAYTQSLNYMMAGGLSLSSAPYNFDKVVAVSPHYVTDVYLANNAGNPDVMGQTRAGYEEYVKATKNCAIAFGIYYADSYAALGAVDPSLWLSADGLHPNDIGHQIITDACTASKIANALTRPSALLPSYSDNLLSMSLTAAPTSVLGDPIGYEFGTINISDYSDGPSTTSSSLSTSLTLANGRYFYKARALFAGGYIGPWIVNNAINFMFTSSARDSFTAGPAGTLLNGKVAALGGTWTALSGSDLTSALSNVGTLKGPTTNSKTAQYNITTLPFNNGIFVEFDISIKSNTNSQYLTGAFVRSNGVLAARSGIQVSYSGSGGLSVFSVVAGVATSIMTYATALTSSAAYRIRLELRSDNTQQLYISLANNLNSLRLIGTASNTDGAPQGFGEGLDLRFSTGASGAFTDTTGTHMTAVKYGNL